MQNIKRKREYEFDTSSNGRCSNDQFWKQYLFDLDSFVYEAFLYSYVTKQDCSKWMMQFAQVPKCFIIKYHDLVHPIMLDHMLEINHITKDEHTSCIYPSGYPSQFYFG